MNAARRTASSIAEVLLVVGMVVPACAIVIERGIQKRPAAASVRRMVKRKRA